jgi:hypothetical protein
MELPFWRICSLYVGHSVPDPEKEQLVRYGSGSGSRNFHHQAKLIEKPLFLLFCDFLMIFLSLKNDVNVPSKSSLPKKLGKKIIFVGVLKVTDEKSRIRS